jgi:serine/threonine protein kinase
MIVVTSSGSKYRLLEPLQGSKKGGTVTVNKRFSTSRKPTPSASIDLNVQKNTPVVDEWKLLDNNSIQGYVFNHPTIPDGQIINTSTLRNPRSAAQQRTVDTISGSKYRLGEPEMSGKVAAVAPTPAASTSDGGGGLFSFFSAPSSPRGPVSQDKPAPAASPVKEPERKAGVATATTDTAMSAAELRAKRVQAQRDFALTGESIGDNTKYLLAGTPTKSTSGKSMIYRAYKADKDGLPMGDPEVDAITVKVSSNDESIEREAKNYQAISQSGLTRGKFVSFIEYLSPDKMNSSTGRSKKQSALVLERGEEDLKTYLSKKRANGGLSGKELREAAAAAAQCVQAAHQSGLVWTDLKTENFVVTRTGEFRGIDLESAMPIKGNPVDYSPEACPPEFAQAFLDGDGPYFTLQTNYDIWSLGMMFYELGTSRGYFDGKSPIQITRALSQMDKFEIGDDVEIDGRFKSLIETCLQVDPNRRPSAAQVLLHPYFITTGIGPFSF